MSNNDKDSEYMQKSVSIENQMQQASDEPNSNNTSISIPNINGNNKTNKNNQTSNYQTNSSDLHAKQTKSGPVAATDSNTNKQNINHNESRNKEEENGNNNNNNNNNNKSGDDNLDDVIAATIKDKSKSDLNSDIQASPGHTPRLMFGKGAFTGDIEPRMTKSEEDLLYGNLDDDEIATIKKKEFVESFHNASFNQNIDQDLDRIDGF